MFSHINGIHYSHELTHDKEDSKFERRVFMKKDYQNGVNNKTVSFTDFTLRSRKRTPSQREEISMELAELGNLNPKHEPMTQNQRKKREQ